MTKNIKYIFFDFETTGLGKPVNNQQAIELSWITTDENLHIIQEHDKFFQNNKEINLKFHGESVMEHIKNTKFTRKQILNLFLDDIQMMKQNNGLLVAHNLKFDIKILENECKSENIERFKVICQFTPIVPWKIVYMFVN